LQVFAPGVQLPEQLPLDAVQTKAQALPLFCQAPVASQVCGCRAVHVFAPGAHVPAQTPAEQT